MFRTVFPSIIRSSRLYIEQRAATAIYKLLMMGMKMPETCWAVFKRRAINPRDWCIWLVDLFECMMMHAPTNPKHGLCNVNLFPSVFSLFHHKHWPRNFRLDRVSGVRRYSQMWIASKALNWMTADRCSSLKHFGSQKQRLCSLNLEGKYVVWRYSCRKENSLSHGTH